MNNTQKRTLRRIIIEAALLLLLLPLQALSLIHILPSQVVV